MQLRTLVIDNFDSFTFNLVHLVARCGGDPLVLRADQIDFDHLETSNFSHVVISPGPGHPEPHTTTAEVLRRYQTRCPVLGVCLGHQYIAALAGARVHRAPLPVHGRIAALRHDGRGLFTGIPDGFAVARYHSLVVDPESLPEELEVTARTAEGLVMALGHRQRPIFGLQFHPESFMTEHGETLVSNFLRTA